MAEQPPPPDQRAEQVAAILASVAVAGATGAAAATTADALAALTRLLLSWGWSRVTVRHTLRVTTTIVKTLRTTTRLDTVGGRTPAYDRAVADELTFAGWFVERTATRVQDAIDKATRAGEDVDQAVADQVAREERWQAAHDRAQEKRREAADRVDVEAAKPGTLEADREPTGSRNADGGTPGYPDDTMATRPRKVVAWVTVNDDRATPECVAADGCWFYADTPPVIGYPGQPHGGTCRCVPGRATRAMFLQGRHVDEAVAGLLEPTHRRHPGTSTTERDRPAA